LNRTASLAKPASDGINDAGSRSASRPRKLPASEAWAFPHAAFWTVEEMIDKVGLK